MIADGSPEGKDLWRPIFIIIQKMNKRAVTMSLWNKILAGARAGRLFAEGDAILLAVSGGPDSVVMLDFFQSCKRSLILSAGPHNEISSANLSGTAIAAAC